MTWTFDEATVLACSHPAYKSLDCDSCRASGSTCINICVECSYDWGFIELDRMYAEEIKQGENNGNV